MDFCGCLQVSVAAVVDRHAVSYNLSSAEKLVYRLHEREVPLESFDLILARSERP